MTKRTYCGEAQMFIRKPAADVFEAFIDPTITQNFWFTKGSGRLEVGKEITWTWEMYNFSAKAVATEITPHKKIIFNWYAYSTPTQVTIEFQELKSVGTFVSVLHDGFDLEGDALTDAVKDSSGGFALVMAGLKAFLEHGLQLNLVADKYPKEFSDHVEDLRKRIED